MRLIDAETLIEELARRDTTDGKVKVFSGLEVVDAIESTPIVDAEPIRHGRWVLDVGIGLYCSECGIDIGDDFDWLDFVHYCPNCGAKMDKE